MKRNIIIFLGVIILISILFTAIKDQFSIQAEKEIQNFEIITKTEERILTSDIRKSLKRPYKSNTVYDESLRVTDIVLPLLFGKSLSKELKQFILQDFNLLFEYCERYELYDWNTKNTKRIRSVDFYGDTYKCDKRLYLVQGRPPSILHGKFGDIAKVNGIDHILIHEEIIEAYEEALNFTQKHLPEYEQLADFIYMMTEASEENPITLHPEDIVYMPGAPAMKRLEEDPSLIPKAQKFYSKTTRLRMPSVLEFKSAPLTMQAKGISLMAVAYSLKDDTQIPSTAISLVYHDGRWKINGSN